MTTHKQLKKAKQPAAAAPVVAAGDAVNDYKPAAVTISPEAAAAFRAAAAAPDWVPLHKHLVMDIEYALKNWGHRDWENAAKCFVKNNGQRYRGRELKFDMWEAHNKGARFAPLEKCDNFDDAVGCLGHSQQLTKGNK